MGLCHFEPEKGKLTVALTNSYLDPAVDLRLNLLTDKEEVSELVATVKMPEDSFERLKIEDDSIVEVVDRNPDLFEIDLATRAAGGLAGLLDGGEQQGDQDRDDRDDNQQFDQRKARAARTGSHVESSRGWMPREPGRRLPLITWLHPLCQRFSRRIEISARHSRKPPLCNTIETSGNPERKP